jgi:hypothetical protein
MTPIGTPTHAPYPPLSALAGTRRFTVDEYHRLIGAGLLGSEDKVELLDGYILLKPDHVDPPPTDGPFPEWRWLRRWTRDEFRRMVELGVIGADEQVKLLDGYLVTEPPAR